MRIGLVSDTHGHLDPKLRELFAGCDRILHAGDIGSSEVLEALEAVAPVTAIRGNVDEGTDVGWLADTAVVVLEALTALVVHDLGPREHPNPSARAILAMRAAQIVVHGHSHRPGARVVGPRLFVNPGSAGPRRFSLPRAAGLLTIDGRNVRVELFDLAGERLVPLGAPLGAVL